MAELNNDVAADVLEAMPEEEVRICLFSIGEDIYAIPVELLTEIIIPQKLFPVPTTPPHVLGVINLRGNIVPIVDIRSVLSIPPQSAPGQVAIVRYGSTMIGIMVDNVYEVIRVPESSVQLIAPDHGMRTGKNRGRFATGLIQRQSDVVVLLNIPKIFEEIRLT